MTSADDSTSVAMPSDELLCVTCGYDLRGQSDDANCPECGSPVERSLRGDALEAADPDWLDVVTRGVWLCGIGCRVMIITIVAFYAVFIAYAVMVETVAIADDLEDALGEAIQRTAQAALFMALVLSAVGAVLFTRRDPRVADREGWWSDHNVARYAMAATLVFAATAFGMLTLGSGTPMAVLGSVCALLGSWALCLAAVAAFNRLELLARRAGDSDLAKRWSNLRYSLWLALPGFGLSAAVRIVVATFGAAGALRWLGVGAGAGLLIFGIWLLVIAGRSARLLKQLCQRINACRGRRDQSLTSKSANSKPGATTQPSRV